LSEIIMMLRLGLLKIVLLRPSMVTESWRSIEKHDIYEADAIQIVSAKHVRTSEFYTANKKLCDIAGEEGVKVVCIA